MAVAHARRVNLGPIQSKGEERAAAMRRVFVARGTPELDDYARARLDPFYGIAIVEDDPYAPDGYVGDAWDDSPPAGCPYRTGKRLPRTCTRTSGHEGAHDFPTEREASIHQLSAVVAPAEPVAALTIVSRATIDRPTCDRCGQRFRASGKGLAWHVANRPDCAARLAVVA